MDVCEHLDPLPARSLPESLRLAIVELWDELERELGPGPECARCGECCDFPRARHRLYGEFVEALLALSTRAPFDAGNLARGRCPFHDGTSCVNRAGRLLGCRTFFCAPAGRLERQDLHERFLRRLRALAALAGFAPDYRPFLEHLRALSGSGAPREPGARAAP
jgi:hypothetical protein